MLSALILVACGARSRALPDEDGAGGGATGPCAPRVLASNLGSPTDIALDQGYAYFGGGDSVRRIHKLGGSVELLPTIPTRILEVWGEELFGAPGRLERMNVDGSNRTLLSEPLDSVRGFAVDDTAVYWTTAAGFGIDALYRRAHGAETSDLLITPFEADGRVAVSGSDLYTFDAMQLAVLHVDLRENEVSTLTTFSNDAAVRGTALAVDADNVVYAASDSGLFRLPRSGGATQSLSAAEDIRGLELRGGFAYFTSWGAGDDTGSVRRVSLADGASTTIAERQQGPVSVAVDETCVYWVNWSNDGRPASLHRAPR